MPLPKTTDIPISKGGYVNFSFGKGPVERFASCANALHPVSVLPASAEAQLTNDPLLQDGRPNRPGYAPKVEECFGPQDFRIGTVLNVYGRQLLIHDCDAFTCTWLQVLLSFEVIEVPVCTVTLVLQTLDGPSLAVLWLVLL